ncbi:MAG: YggS family pyridoxal phosphate-dependent enzyme [Candidatus Hydrogenedentes bacterium]|nr:YggS family pyridoxal phosphate-dependent enzyme [Candidatus Hydrogenedentota bacterium]
MPVATSKLQENLERVRERISTAALRAGRSSQSVRLVAVTKTVNSETIQALLALGIEDFGENRIAEARPKIEEIGHVARWHMIGPIQRRKAKEAIELFDTVDALDRIEVGQALQQRCDAANRTLPVLIEVNVSGETTKHGFFPEHVPDALATLQKLPHLHVAGLMTMAPLVQDPEVTRPHFARLRSLAESLGLPELSMGMSNDFEVAVEEGATQVRIGTALFA